MPSTPLCTHGLGEQSTHPVPQEFPGYCKLRKKHWPIDCDLKPLAERSQRGAGNNGLQIHKTNARFLHETELAVHSTKCDYKKDVKTVWEKENKGLLAEQWLKHQLLRTTKCGHKKNLVTVWAKEDKGSTGTALVES